MKSFLNEVIKNLPLAVAIGVGIKIGDIMSKRLPA